MSLGFEEISNYLIKELEEYPDYFYDKINARLYGNDIDIDLVDPDKDDIVYVDKNNFTWKLIKRDGLEIFGVDVKFKGLYEYPEEISEFLPDEIINEELEMKSFDIALLVKDYGYELGVLGTHGGYWGIDLTEDITLVDLLKFVEFNIETIDEEYLIETIAIELSRHLNIENTKQIDEIITKKLDLSDYDYWGEYDNWVVDLIGLSGLNDYEFTDNFKKCANEFTDTVKYFESKESMLNFLQGYDFIPEVKEYLDKQK